MGRVDLLNGLTGNLAVKAPCRVATTANITLSGAQTIDSVSLNADADPRERVLVKDQTDTTENGIYDVNSGAWTRSPDCDGFRDVVNGTQVLVAEGSVPIGKAYYLSGTNPIVIGTDALTFELAPNHGFEVVDDLTPQLSGALDLNSFGFVTSSGGTAISNGEIATLDGITAGTGTIKAQLDALDAAKVNAATAQFTGQIDLNGQNFITSSGGTTISNAEFATLDGVTAGTGTIYAQITEAATTGGLVLIETQTASSDATIDFTTGINSTYDEYELHILNAIPATDNVLPYIRTSSDTGASFDEGASDYRWGGRGQASTGGVYAGGDAADIAIVPSTVYTVGSDANELGVCATLNIVRPSEATFTRMHGTVLFTHAVNGAVVSIVLCGERVSAGVVDAIRFLFSSGDIESGIFKLYGVKKS